MLFMYNNTFKIYIYKEKVRKLSIFCLQDFHPFLAPDLNRIPYHFLVQLHPYLHPHLHLDLSKVFIMRGTVVKRNYSITTAA